MKRKQISILLALTLAVSMTACSSTSDEATAEETSAEEDASEEEAEEASEEEDASEEEAEETEEAAETIEAVAGETYTGTVAAIAEDSITVETEEGNVVIALSSETEFTYSMGEGGMGGDAPGEGGEMGEAPDGGGEAPDGEAGEMGEAPDGEGEGGGDDAAAENTSSEGGDEGIATLELPEGEDTIGGMNQNPDGSYQVGTGDGGDAPEGEGSAPDGEGGEAPEGDGGAPEDAGEIPTSAGGGDGEAPDGEGGEMGDGEAPDGEGGEPGEMGEGGMEAVTLTWEDIAEGDEVTVVVGDDGTAESVSVAVSMDGGEGGGDMAMGGSSSGVDSYTAVYTYTETTEVEDETLSSTGADENAVLVETEGITVTLEDVTITRDSDESTGGDNSSFYGVGAAALVTDGTLIIEDSVIDSDAAGGAGVFAYGDGVAYVEDTTITTVQDTSGGVHVAGGGTLYAWDLTVETSGESSAAIRSDRGSGTMVVDGGTYTSNWTGSPAVYSTADITVHDATLTANMSEAICIEGLNTIRLFDCDLTGTMQDLETNDCIWTVILYQSMSGDSEVGNSTFEMVGGSLTSNSGGVFYTTNTESTFLISDVDITYSDSNDFLLKVTGNANQRGWGTTGSNGAQCTFTAIDQELAGTIIWDSISELDFYLMDDSTLTGDVADDETNAGDGGSGYANIYISEDSTWIVTGDSVLTGLYNAGTITDEDGDTVTILGSDGTTYVSGSSAYTITVETYSSDADFSGAGELDSWEDFEVEEP